jgi:DNA invertase Pin-like site-specific DNA recombinase
MQAYIYARFSTLEQAKGSSLERQLDVCRALCDRHQWQRSSDRELKDEGRSAYDGTNRADGSALALFELDARQGALPDDTVLVVERLDRLSRQSAQIVFQLVSSLTENGVVVATVDGDRIYRRGSFDFASLIELIVKAQLSYEESEKKSERLAAAWARKRTRAVAGDKTALTKRCPAWLAVDESTGRYVLREERAEIVRRIFKLATSGHGKHLIARSLNREAILPWGRGNGWHPSYIQKILTSRTVVGEMQPHRKVAGKRIVEGEPLPNYYPAVIDENVFARAQADRTSRTGMQGRRGRRISNLFAGIVKCGSCGGTMTFRNKGSVGEQYLVCDTALRGRGCKHTVHFNYPLLEAGIIDQTLHLSLHDRHFGTPIEAQNIEKSLAEGKRHFIELEDRRRRLIDLLSRLEDQEVERQVRDLAGQAALVKAEIAGLERDLVRARGVVSPAENIARIRGLVEAISSEDEQKSTIARGTVQQALRSLIQTVTFDPESQLISVDVGDRTMCFDRRGNLMTEKSPEMGLSKLLQLREKGWVLKKYEQHPALGKAEKPQAIRHNRDV